MAKFIFFSASDLIHALLNLGQKSKHETYQGCSLVLVTTMHRTADFRSYFVDPARIPSSNRNKNTTTSYAPPYWKSLIFHFHP
ncbi:unnamed protein product [Cylindrotheca closterium]|uniref:Uncharacterized protein n=1 Tax=Cylindrotheca closterium TaxID=2856 RepID=A0AAD2FI09_9STRA|nr:unnamed protein product [Cylindrotheca closterium]